MNQNKSNKVFQVRRPGKIEPIYLSNKILTRKRILDFIAENYRDSWQTCAQKELGRAFN